MNIYDIAKETGVSIATVSRVINGAGSVSARTKEKVLRIIQEHRYAPNIFAKGLTTNSMRMIGVLTTSLSNDYFSAAVYTLEQLAKQNGYDILLSFTREDIKEKRKHIRLLAEKRVDGIILVGSTFVDASKDEFILESARSLPIVTLNSLIEANGVYSVFCDDVAGAYKATKYLYSKGRQNIAYIYDEATYSNTSKLKGYKAAVAETERQHAVIKTTSGISGGAQAVEKLFSGNKIFDGIICSEDKLAVGVLKQLLQNGIDVPGDVAVIGYNDLILAHCTNPELASVNGKVELLSTYALESMLKVLETGTAPQKIVITPELVIRQSAKI